MSRIRTMVLFLFEYGTTVGRCGTGGTVASPLAFPLLRLLLEPFAWYVDGGVVLPFKPEFKVDEDLAVGTAAVESLDESEVRKLAFERLRNSLKNGMLYVQ
jgi:hypothetical protein